jgi:hypothetical protein
MDRGSLLTAGTRLPEKLFAPPALVLHFTLSFNNRKSFRLLLYLLMFIFPLRLSKAVPDRQDGIPAFLAEGGIRVMIMKSGERWHCLNPACHCAVVVRVGGETPGQNPRCACGNVMKKDYSPPVFRYLDFLRFPEPVLTPWDSRED